ncbi:hypothetical protein M422DRAFT_263856 [Sphaerobolus stellatus SS14]|uniref:Uncharacterized protein n=1 Tax=Sphaerobolus stellatus (strain SS14) TaxID=990650 RepID=A0A0C9UGX5_SPHS4|nr:hypothetical protein M422DRAFT_263856 [Sphaerobolus stellatus SS14]
MDQIFDKKGGPTIKDCPQPHPRVWPMMNMVLADLFAAEEPDPFDPYNFTARYSRHGTTSGEIVENIFWAASRDDFEWERMELLAALRIPPSGKDGLRKCELTYHPYQEDPTFTLRRRSCWSSVLLPPGAIQHPHVQIATSSQIIRHITGLILWFFWPWTEHNIKIFKRRVHQHRAEMELENDIGKWDNFEGLELRWNTEVFDCFYIPPCHFTAYIVFTPSSFARLQIWGLSEFSKAHSSTKTILDIHHSPLHRVNMELLNPFITWQEGLAGLKYAESFSAPCFLLEFVESFSFHHHPMEYLQ